MSLGFIMFFLTNTWYLRTPCSLDVVIFLCKNENPQSINKCNLGDMSIAYDDRTISDMQSQWPGAAGMLVSPHIRPLKCLEYVALVLVSN